MDMEKKKPTGTWQIVLGILFLIMFLIDVFSGDGLPKGNSPQELGFKIVVVILFVLGVCLFLRGYKLNKK